MNNNLVRVAILQDRSDSIRTNNLVAAFVGGLNEFIGELRSQPGDVNVRLIQFDTLGYDVVFDKPLNDVPHMTKEMLVPRGGTPLIDAQARTILELGQELSNTPEHERPGKVIVMTMTDGEENSSKHYSSQQVLEMIQVQRDIYKWAFMYCGCNQDSFAVAAKMGIQQDAVMNYAPSAPGVRSTYRSMGAQVNAVRSAVRGGFERGIAFTNEDREKAMHEDPVTANR